VTVKSQEAEVVFFGGGGGSQQFDIPYVILLYCTDFSTFVSIARLSMKILVRSQSIPAALYVTDVAFS
jgi:hypothetical protein